MSGWLEWVEPCEHGKSEWPLNLASNANDFVAHQCPGGSRRRVDPDYEAAGKEVARVWSVDTSWMDWPFDVQLMHIADAKRIVDAALGLAGEE